MVESVTKYKQYYTKCFLRNSDLKNNGIISIEFKFRKNFTVMPLVFQVS